MGITAITRDWGDSATIVRIITTNTLAEVAVPYYLLVQKPNIVIANKGEFSWELSDFILVYASDGFNFFTIDSTFNTLTVANIGSGGSITIPVTPAMGGTGTIDIPTQGEILVGNSSGIYDVATVVGEDPITVSYSELLKQLTIGIDQSHITQVLPPGYWTGLHITFGSNTEINLASGAARSSTNISSIFTAAGNIIDITASGVNGLDTGTVAANTTYYVFNIGDSTLVNPGRGMFSLSSTAPTMPLNYNVFRLVGRVHTDGSSHIVSSLVVDLINNAPLDSPTLTGVLTVTSPNSVNFSNLSNAIWVSDKQTGTGIGTQTNPFSSFADAIAASVTDSVIVVDGVFTTANFSVKPITIVGWDALRSSITVSSVTLDNAAWQAATAPKLLIQGVTISGSLTLTASAIKANSKVILTDVTAASFSAK